MSAAFILTLISVDPELIRAADDAGIDHIGIDIERLGKRERQGFPNARISGHEIEDLAIVAANAKRAAVFVRLNPLHPGSKDEIERAVGLGAKVVMLPYFTTSYEVASFVDMVGGRASVALLLETAAGAARLREIVAVPGISEIMVGLNDLHRAFGLANHFEMLASELLVTIGRQVRDAGLRFGVGGVARAGDRSLPVPADVVLAQFPRLGATSAWIARSFFKPGDTLMDFQREVGRLREAIDHWFRQPPAILEDERLELSRLAAALGSGSRA